MRTVQRQTVELNSGKEASLVALLRAFAQEKRYWLAQFEKKDQRRYIRQHRIVRNAAIKGGYQPVSGLQARMWKLALIEAAETWDKWYEALFVKVRQSIRKRQGLTDVQRHYAFWLLSHYGAFFDCMDGMVPAPKFDVSEADKQKICFMVQRLVRRHRGNNPCVRMARSAVFDADCYKVFIYQDIQYIELMSLTPRVRIAVPLRGHSAIAGNIRLVNDGNTFSLHVMHDFKKKAPMDGPTLGVDMGYTEAFTDNEDNRYGDGLGSLITTASDQRNAKGKQRNKLRALARSYAASNSATKRARARHIKKYNLGNTKWDKRERASHDAIACKVNEGLNQLVALKAPAKVVSEDLSHTFTYKLPKTWNRRLAAWVRGVLTDRIAFKALAKGFSHQQVNPAYTSQLCPVCGFVDSANRKWDRFECLYCGCEGPADWIAAINVLARSDDPRITKFTPFAQVKIILEEAFIRRLEAEGSASPDVTVPGWTSDTGLTEPTAVNETPVTAGRRKSAASTRRSLEERKKIKCIKNA